MKSGQARPRGIRPVNATTTTDIGQPRSLSARQKHGPSRSLPSFFDFDGMISSSSSHDFGIPCFVKSLPVCASPSHLFDNTTPAINALGCTKIQDFKLPTAPDVIDAPLGKELVPPLDPQADQELSADVRAADEAAKSAGMWSPFELLTAVHTAAYPTTRCRKIGAGQSCDIVAYLPQHDDTAHKWAVLLLGPQNTQRGHSTSAAAFYLLQSEELAPPRFAATSAAFELQNGASGGRGRERTEGWEYRNIHQAEQVSGPGVQVALGRSR
jgi:hypothetical protein